MPLFILGMLLMVSGLFHVVVWLLQGGSLEGPVSWRKPIAFGLSGGITTLSLGWMLGYVPQRTGLKLSVWIYTTTMFFEVALITMQKWRGVGSHFNLNGSFNAAVFTSMGFLIIVAALVIGWWTWLSIRGLLTRPDMSFAILAGLIFLNVGNVLGLFLAVYGSMQQAVSPGHVPNIFGQAGMMKIPHAVALHGIQILPFLSWLLLQASTDAEKRLKRVKLAVFGYAGLLLFTLVQTFSGRAPLDMTILSAALGLSAACMVLLPFLSAATLLSRKLHDREVTP